MPVELGTPSAIVSVFNTGRNDILKASMKLSTPSGVEFTHKDAALVGESPSVLWHIPMVSLLTFCQVVFHWIA